MVKRTLMFILMFISLIFLWADVRYSLLQVSCQTEIEMRNLIRNGFDVLQNNGMKNNTVEVVANQYDRKRLDDLHISYSVAHEDLSAFLRTRLTQPTTRNNQIGQGSLGGYFSYTEIISFVDSLQTTYPNTMSNPVIIGQTLEGHDIKAYKVSDNPNSNENEPEVLIIGLHHAREPMSIIANLYYMKWLLENYNTDLLATHLVNNREIWFVPILNIDGYLYNEQINPNGGGMWRKNKRDNNNNGEFNPSTDGVDLNRNYGYEWGYDDTGSSPLQNAESYRGPSGFSELETQAIRDFCNENTFRTALSFHTFGDLLVYTEHANSDPVPDLELLRIYADDMTKANGYTYGNGTETVNYPTNGDSDAWMYGEQTSKPKIISFTPEIGDRNDYFWAPTLRIIPLAEENLYPQQYISLVAGAFLKAIDSKVIDTVGGDGDMSGEAGETFNIVFKITNKGYIDNLSNVTATLTCSNPLVTINNGSANISNINALSETEIQFNITLSSQLASGTAIDFNINFNNGTDYNLNETYKQIFGSPIILFYDNAENGMIHWNTNMSWNTTEEKAASGAHSFTDSPYENYLDNIENTMTLSQPINLSFANNAILKYKIRWNLERHLDKVQIELNNGNNQWINVPGEYTTYGTGVGVQNFGDQVYNGFKDLKWFDERVSLSNTLTENFTFRYLLKSDESTNTDGVYVDDIMVVAYSDAPMPPIIAYITNNLDNTDSLGPYEISAVASDAQGISSVKIKYSTNNIDFNEVLMVEQEKNFYKGFIPNMELGSTVYYKVQASDQSGNTASTDVYSFMISNSVPNIQVDTNNLNFSVTGTGTDEDQINITNNGVLPLDFTIRALPVIHTRTKNTMREAINIIKEKTKFAKLSSRQKDVKSRTRNPHLIIDDGTGEIEGAYRDIDSVYASIENGQMNMEVFMANPTNWNETLLLISFDTDQNINTGSYPPSFGMGNPDQNIGSDCELLVDAGCQIQAQSGAYLISFDGQQFLGLCDMTLTSNSVQLLMDYSLFGDNDTNVDISMVSMISIDDESIDYAPDLGHGTIGMPGAPGWLTFSPSEGHIVYNQSIPVNLTVSSQYLREGTYEAQMNIQSNDPTNPETTVTISFIVEGTGTTDNPTVALHNKLYSNYPNPFNPDTNIQFSIESNSKVQIEIYNIKGQRVKTLTNRFYDKGLHKVVWNGTDSKGKSVGSGLYFCKMNVNNKNIKTQKMMLIK